MNGSALVHPGPRLGPGRRRLTRVLVDRGSFAAGPATEHRPLGIEADHADDAPTRGRPRAARRADLGDGRVAGARPELQRRDGIGHGVAVDRLAERERRALRHGSGGASFEPIRAVCPAASTTSVAPSCGVWIATSLASPQPVDGRPQRLEPPRRQPAGESPDSRAGDRSPGRVRPVVLDDQVLVVARRSPARAPVADQRPVALPCPIGHRRTVVHVPGRFWRTMSRKWRTCRSATGWSCGGHRVVEAAHVPHDAAVVVQERPDRRGLVAGLVELAGDPGGDVVAHRAGRVVDDGRSRPGRSPRAGALPAFAVS